MYDQEKFVEIFSTSESYEPPSFLSQIWRTPSESNRKIRNFLLLSFFKKNYFLNLSKICT